MTILNLTPVIDALGGTATTPAIFKAEARRAGRKATRVTGDQVAFPTELTAEWDGTAWDTPPQLHVLPVDCYWWVRVAAAGSRLERNVILPDGTSTAVDFGDLIPIAPGTGAVDTSTVQQYQATQRYVSNQVGYIDSVAATIFNQVATVQAQIGTAAQQQQQAAGVLALVQTAQAAIDADVTAVITAATQTGQDRTAVAADRAAAETAQAAAEAARTAAEAAQAAAETAAAVYTTTTTIDGNA